MISRGFLNLARTNARRANPQTPACAIYQRAHLLQVQIPAALGDIVGMTDAVPELRTSAAYLANSCHKPLVYHCANFRRNAAAFGKGFAAYRGERSLSGTCPGILTV
jgi:hypothetical protein